MERSERRIYADAVDELASDHQRYVDAMMEAYGELSDLERRADALVSGWSVRCDELDGRRARDILHGAKLARQMLAVAVDAVYLGAWPA